MPYECGCGLQLRQYKGATAVAVAPHFHYC